MAVIKRGEGFGECETCLGPMVEVVIDGETRRASGALMLLVEVDQLRDQLRGAVEALGAVLAAFDAWNNGTAEDSTSPIWDAIEAARPHVGGQ